MKALAACLLAVLVLRHYGWDAAPEHLAGVASKGLGALEALALLALVAYAFRHPAVWAVVAYGAWEHGQTAICTAAYMVDPWPVAPGEPMCSAAIGFELGSIGIAVAAALLFWLHLSDITVSKTLHGGKND